MRAVEFIVEYKEYPTGEYGGLTFTMKEKDGQLIVRALNAYGISIGHVIFNMDGKILDPQDLEVASKHHRQGIASTMYDYIKSRGFTIERSYDQSDAGIAFWNKHRGEDVRVWEDKSIVPASQIFASVQKIHRDLNDFSEGDLGDRIYWFDDYKLVNLPISKINLDEYWVDEDYVEDYMNHIADSKKTMPPIVFDPIAGSIIDGIHRATAYSRLGNQTIPAYVGNKKSEYYGQSDND